MSTQTNYERASGFNDGIHYVGLALILVGAVAASFAIAYEPTMPEYFKPGLIAAGTLGGAGLVTKIAALIHYAAVVAPAANKERQLGF